MSEFCGLSAEKRATLLQSTVLSARKAQKIVAKILTIASELGDFKEGEMNTYSNRITGVELRRELQGTYECVNVLKAIRANAMTMTEQEFDDCPMFGAIILSSFLAKSPEKVEDALAIIRKGEDVTKKLKELRGGEKPAKEKSEGNTSGESGESAPEIQTLPTNADTFVIPHNEYVTNHAPLVARILKEIENADAEDLTVLSNIYRKIQNKIDQAVKLKSKKAAA